MDLLKAELDRKRQRTNELVAKAGGERGGRKFVRRGEAARIEQEERESKQRELIRLREERRRRREEEERRLEEENAKRKRSVGCKSTDNTENQRDKQAQEQEADNERSPKKTRVNEDYLSAEDDGAGMTGREEVSEREATLRLRALGLPVTFFGESHEQRTARLLQAEEDKGHHQDDYTLTDGHNVNNEFLGNVSSDLTGSHLDAATGRDDANPGLGESNGIDSDDEDDDDDDEDNGRGGNSGITVARAARHGNSSGGQSNSWGEGDQSGGTAGGAAQSGVGEETGDPISGKSAAEKDVEPVKLIRTFFRGLLKEWEMDLNARPDHVKRTVQGKLETKTQKQAKDYLRPLFKLCKQKALPEGIANNLTEMINYMKEGEFVKANDVYLLTAIGNAPWPIGLTMVGIHERSGRERISSKNVAHIMNNEAQRKYLVSVKRLMTYLQDKRTDIAPSKKVR